MKKYLALVLTLAMLLACAPAFTLTALADTTILFFGGPQ